MSKETDDRLVRSVELTIEWCNRGRAKGGARLRRLACRLLSEAKSDIKAHGCLSGDAREKLLSAMGYLTEYLEVIR